MPTTQSIFVLDAFALLAFFQAEEPAASQVRELLEKAERHEVKLYLSIINLGEIFYITAKNIDHHTAEQIKQDTIKLPLSVVSISDDQVVHAMEIKACHNLSFCDAFVVAIAQELGAVIVTGDPEFHCIESIVDVYWLNTK